MLNRGEAEQETRAKPAGGSAVPRHGSFLPLMNFGRSITLIPHSGIQFIDFGFSASELDGVRARFLEEKTAGGYGQPQRVLYPIAMEHNVLFHPISHEPLNISATTVVTGRQGLLPFLDRWVPVPIMRETGKSDEGQIVYDEGPANWARVYVSAVNDQAGAAADSFRVVFALDTAICDAGREQDDAYLGPTHADISLSSVFSLSDSADDVAWFVSEPWVDGWIRKLYLESCGDQAGAPHRGSAQDDLEHLARYLTFLSVIKQLCKPPSLSFLDLRATAKHIPPVAVDLVLDIGNNRSFGMLMEQRGGSPALDLSDASVLSLRDLSKPVHVYGQAFDSHVEFVPPPFGDAAMSRQSGRANAFYWPSFARVGAEALRLGAMAGAGGAGSGISSPKRYLWDSQPREDFWRFAGSNGAAGPRVSGPLLAYLSEDGDVMSRAKADGTGPMLPAVRPKFSRSSLLSFFLCEVVLQVIGQVNSPFARAQRPMVNAARVLKRVIVTMPVGMPPEEHTILCNRLEGAIDLVWQALGWTGAGEPAVPPRPEIVIGIDEAMCAQMVYLYDQVTGKFTAPAQDYFNVKGKPRAEYGVQPALRIASIDIGAGTTGLAVVTYQSTGQNDITLTQQLRVGVHVGGDDVLRAVITRHLMPAVEDGLRKVGMEDARGFLQTLFSSPRAADIDDSGALRKRFANQIASPLALLLLDDYETRAPLGPVETVSRSFGDLLTALGGCADGVADEFDAMIAQRGIVNYSLRNCTISYRYRELSATVREQLGSVLADLSDIACSMDCDLFLVSGRPAQLPDVEDLLLSRLPVRQDRIVIMNDYHPGKWYPLRAKSSAIGDGKSVVATGALIHALANGRLAGFSVTAAAHRAGSDMQRYTGRIDKDGQITPVSHPAALSDGTGGAKRRSYRAAEAGAGDSGRLVVLELNEEAVFGGAPPSLANGVAHVPAVIAPGVPDARAIGDNGLAEGAGEGADILFDAQGGDAAGDAGDGDAAGNEGDPADGHWLDTGVIATY